MNGNGKGEPVMQHGLSYATLALVGGALIPWASEVAAQPAYPSKLIRVLVGVPPGGSTDLITRMYAEWLHESLGQPGIVENRPGGNTTAAAEAVARAAPDGYTLLLATDALVALPLLTKLTFDPFKDLAPIGTIGVSRFVLAVHPSLPVNNVKELVALAKARPGQMNYASSGNAGTSHLGLEKFKLLTATNMVHIPYKGAGPAIVDAIAGHVQVSMWTPLAIAAHVQAGKLKPLAATGPKRVPLLPNVPTFGEAGFPAYDHNVWFAVFAPAGTPRQNIDRLAAEIAKMIAAPKHRQRLDSSGVEPLLLAPEPLATMIRSQAAELQVLIKTANIKMD
jgi:tripartite-type tricarboxylate transporter receptor subunit TctC